MKTNHKQHYIVPTVEVVELKLKSGVLIVSTNSPEGRNDSIGNWGGKGDDFWF